jgi:hypothetical protein
MDDEIEAMVKTYSTTLAPDGKGNNTFPTHQEVCRYRRRLKAINWDDEEAA